MADTDARSTQSSDLGRLELNTVGQPDIVRQPAYFLEVVHRPEPENPEAVVGFIKGYGQMSMEPDSVVPGQPGRLDHQCFSDRKRGTGCQDDLYHRAGFGVMIVLQEPFAVSDNSFLVLHHTCRRQSAICRRKTHRASSQCDSYAKPVRFFNLQVNGMFQARRKDIVVIRCSGAPRQQEFGERQPG